MRMNYLPKLQYLIRKIIGKMEMDNFLVSVITPAYNCELFIEYTIESVINQTYKNWEMIIVNDCSTDNTFDILKKYSEKDNRIKIINLNKNVGVSEARNIAIRNAVGKYIAFLDSDDLWTSEKLEKQVMFMEDNKYLFTFTDYGFIDHNNYRLEKVVVAPLEVKYKDALKGNSIPCLTVMINKEAVNEIYFKNIGHEDYATWLAILKNGVNAYSLNCKLAYYRRHNNSLSSNKIKSIIWTWNIYYNNEKITLPLCFYYMIHYIIKSIKKHYA